MIGCMFPQWKMPFPLEIVLVFLNTLEDLCF
ncbi:hypothetical protein GLYMA_13G030802v4 [Glycine max]|nr:hypothetical protein GLYMA_13G030802v4 [Glycine max]KAH1099581.1 hypothetical protein GYH30_034972 [Glycine max]